MADDSKPDIVDQGDARTVITKSRGTVSRITEVRTPSNDAPLLVPMGLGASQILPAFSG
ncbi:MAG: hypothetical protein ACRCU2_14890 [Planktothrix sp.]